MTESPIPVTTLRADLSIDQHVAFAELGVSTV